MNINPLSNAHHYEQSNSHHVNEIAPIQPIVESRGIDSRTNDTQEQPTISGKGVMLSRLFGDTNVFPAVQIQLTKDTQDIAPVNFLTLDDRNVLSGLYAYAQEQGIDLQYVDDLASDLGKYRKFGDIAVNYNTGNTYDPRGQQQIIEFTSKDSATAARILNSDNVDNAILDPDFLRYELDPGYSFNHMANFDFIESIINGYGDHSAATAPKITSGFLTYIDQGTNNYVIKPGDKITLIIEEPDIIGEGSSFIITETGKKHGFRLEGNNVVQDKDLSVPGALLQSANTQLNYIEVKKQAEEAASEKPFSLLNSLLSSKLDHQA